jgi:hypothetical protein
VYRAGHLIANTRDPPASDLDAGQIREDFPAVARVIAFIRYFFHSEISKENTTANPFSHQETQLS